MSFCCLRAKQILRCTEQQAEKKSFFISEYIISQAVN